MTTVLLNVLCQVGFWTCCTAAGRTRSGSGLTVDGLTDRELQVFELVGRGLSTRQVAEQLNLDVSTIETYRARIKEKLNLRDSIELLQCAIRWNSSFRV